MVFRLLSTGLERPSVFSRSSLSYSQIRNAFQTAVALAEFETKEILSETITKSNEGALDGYTIPVKVKHFEKLAEAAAMFDEYLKETHGGRSEAFMSSLNQERNDDFRGKPRAQMAPPPAGRPRQPQAQQYANPNTYAPGGFATEQNAPPDDSRSNVQGYGAPQRRPNDAYRQSPRMQAPGSENINDTLATTSPNSRTSMPRQPTANYGLNIQQPFREPAYGTPTMQSPQLGRPSQPSSNDRFSSRNPTTNYHHQSQEAFHQQASGNSIEVPKGMSISQQHEHDEYVYEAEAMDMNSYQRPDSRYGDEKGIQGTRRYVGEGY